MTSTATPSSKWRYFCEFYTLTILVASTYVWYRRQYIGTDIEMGNRVYKHETDFELWEKKVLGVCLSTTLVKAYTARSTDNRVALFIGFLRWFVLAMAVSTSTLSGLTYGLAFLAIWLLFNHPMYEGPDMVERFTPLHISDPLLNPESDVAYVLYAYTSWSIECRLMYATFAELSNQYTTDKVKFCKMDLAEWPSMAKKLGVDISGVSKELPNIMMFEKGQMVAWLPRARGKTNYNKRDIIRVLELDQRYARSFYKADANKQH